MCKYGAVSSGCVKQRAVVRYNCSSFTGKLLLLFILIIVASTLTDSFITRYGHHTNNKQSQLQTSGADRLYGMTHGLMGNIQGDSGESAIFWEMVGFKILNKKKPYRLIP